MEDLFRAVKLEDEAVVEKYCTSGGNVNVLDSSSHKKSTPLHWAAYTGNVDVIKLLIDHGSKLDTQETDGRTPLHLAAFEGHEDAVRMLLGAGSDYTFVDESQKTPCDVAIMQQYYEIAKLFPNYKSGAADPPPRPQVDDLINLRDNTLHSPPVVKQQERSSQVNTSEYVSNPPMRSSFQQSDSPPPFESARNRSPNPMQQTQRGRSSYDEDRVSVDDGGGGRRHWDESHVSYQPPSKRDDRNTYEPIERVSGRGSPGRFVDDPPMAIHVTAGQDAYPVEGTFVLARGKSWEGMPVWECHLPDTGRMGCIYSGANGLWIITEDACHMNDDSGLITSVHKHNGMYPNEVTQWETHDGQSWVVDHSVSVDVVKGGGGGGGGGKKSSLQPPVAPPSRSNHRDRNTSHDSRDARGPPAASWRDEGPSHNSSTRPHSSSSVFWRVEEEEEDERHSWWGQEERSRRHLEKRYRREMRELMEEFGSQQGTGGGGYQPNDTPDYYRGRGDYPPNGPPNGAHERRAMEAAAARALLDPDDFDAFLEDKERRRAARRQARREARDEERRIRREARRREKERERHRSRSRSRHRSSSRPRKDRSERGYDRYGERYHERYEDRYDDRSHHSHHSNRREGRSRSRKRGKSTERSPARSISRSSVRSHSTSRSYRSSSRRSRSRSRGRDKPNPRPWLPPGSSNSVTGKRISQTFSDYGTPLRGWEESSPARHRSVSRGRRYY